MLLLEIIWLTWPLPFLTFFFYLFSWSPPTLFLFLFLSFFLSFFLFFPIMLVLLISRESVSMVNMWDDIYLLILSSTSNFSWLSSRHDFFDFFWIEYVHRNLTMLYAWWSLTCVIQPLDDLSIRYWYIRTSYGTPVGLSNANKKDNNTKPQTTVQRITWRRILSDNFMLCMPRHGGCPGESFMRRMIH